MPTSRNPTRGSVAVSVKKGGAQVNLPPTDIDGVGTTARFRDAHGNTIGLVRSATTADPP